jgi:hypothetical protein
MFHLFCVIVLLQVLLAKPAIAQEIFGLGGAIQDIGSGGSSYSWQIEYRQALNEYLAASISYLNEGHISSHHRDSHTAQLWAGTRLADRRLSLSVGIGPLYYYDTVPASSDISHVNEHGWGLNSSLAAIWHTDSRWLLQLRSNWIESDSRHDTVSVLVGVGYQLEPSAGPSPSAAISAESQHDRPNELVAYVGRTIVNSLDSEHSVAVGIEYRRQLSPYLEGSISWLYEGDSRLVRRHGFTGEIWAARYFLDERLGLGIGGGLYFNADRYSHVVEQGDTDRLVSGIVSLTGSFRVTPEWELRTVWHRIVTNYDRDTDVLLGGIGIRF